jgi:hypothetical protein
MNHGKYVFSQISEFIPHRIFDGLVDKYQGNYRVRHFTCWNQMMCMIFGQMSNRESLSDLVLTISAHPSKIYHLGFGKAISKTTLAKSNEQRNWRIYQEFADHLIRKARGIIKSETASSFSFQNAVYAFDSTTIDLCLNLFCWATFRKTKGAIKLHTQYDVRTSIPVFIDITSASQHDVNAMDKISYEAGSYYIFDRGYLDFERLYAINLTGSYFVIRAKNNLQFERIYSSLVNKKLGVYCDQTIYLKGFYSTKGYPEKLRRIKYYDEEQNRTFVFLTNQFNLEAIEIAQLYKERWKIELFFKWIKQHLKINTFWGQSANAVKTQVYIAIITYTLVAIIKQQLKSSYSCYEILQILGTSLLDKTPVNQLLQKKNKDEIKDDLYNQLSIF